MEPANHRFDGNPIELSGHRLQHVENAAVRTAREYYQLSVFLYRHDDLVGKIIKRKGTISFQIDIFISDRPRIGVQHMRDKKNVREYLGKLSDSLESIRIVRHERLVQADVFLYKPEYLDIAIPLGRLPKMNLRTGV